MITYNRAEYTRLALKQLCSTAEKYVRITVWDNNSNEETKNVLHSYENHPAIDNIIYNKTNDKLTGPTNWFWQHSQDADYIGKVDDDCLVPHGWVSTLTQAHQDVPQAGILGCWRFPDSDFNKEWAPRKIQKFGRHSVLRHCWVEGSGYLMKRAVIDETGLLEDKGTFTVFCIKAAKKGYVNGWYYPFLYQEHMDDPLARHTGLTSESEFQRLLPLSAKKFGAQNLQEWSKQLRKSAQRMQKLSYNPNDYLGFSAKVKKTWYKFIGKTYFPIVK